MKNTRSCMYYRLFIFVLLCAFSYKSFAYDFKVDGLCYDILSESEHTVEVTYETEPIGNPAYKNIFGELFIPETVSYNNNTYKVTSIGYSAFRGCSSLTGSLIIPNSVTTIKALAFSGCSGFTGSLIIPNSVTFIGYSAFLKCSGFSSSLSIPNSVTSIGNSAFQDCSGFTGSLVIPNSVTSIENYTFWGCSGFSGSLEIPNSVTSIGDGGFYRCSGFTGSLTIPNTVKTIGEFAFYRCSGLTGSLTIPNSVKSIGQYAFDHCSGFTGSLTISNSLTTIEESVFGSCHGFTGSLAIPNSVTSIKSKAFSLCSGFTGTLTIPNSVISIGNSAFQDCSGLISITIGNGIQSVSERAFASCKNVADVYCYATEVPLTNGTAFEDSNIEQSTLHVPESSIDSYKALFPWSGFKSVTSIEGNKAYTLSITSTANGSVTYSGNTIDGTTKSFTVNEGTSATLTFTPNSNYQICSVKVDGVDVTSSVSNNQYTISNIKRSTTVEVKFEEIISSFTYHGVNCRVLSNTEKTVIIAHGDYDQALEVPASFTVNGVTWYVNGIDNDVMTDNPQLAAVIWNPAVKFDAKVSNPNFLLYVTSAGYAPSGIKNVIVNGTADNITLTEADSGNDFYCPKAFAARSISYTHNYSMITGIGECRGWETIALPFNVQKIVHSEKGQVVPFAVWQKGETQRPFWLYELTGNGWKEAGAIKAYTPYVISMPNNELYYESSCLNGQVTFSAENVAVEATNSHQVSYNGKTFVPNFSVRESNGYVYALNVKNDWAAYNGSLTEGSHFVQNLRTVHPFEAYMTTENNARAAISIFDDDATEVQGVKILLDQRKIKGVYNLNGQKLDGDNDRKLPAGIYIIDGQKVMVK